MAIKSTAESVLTAAAQLVLNKNGARLAVDGVLGSATRAALQTADAQAKARISSFEDALSVKLPVEQHTEPAADQAAIKALISSLATREGVPPTTALTIAYLESKFRPGPMSHTGARGLFQLTTIAINDVRARNSAGLLPSVFTDVMKPEHNTLIALRYMQLVSRDMGVALREIATIYMGYNIGPTGAKAVLAGQPERAAKVISQQSFGPPAVYAMNLKRAVDSVVV